MAKIPYVVPKRFDSASPKGKYPFVRINNETIGDSTLIIGRLKTIFKSSLDEKLTPKELAVSRAFQRLAEEHLYWADGMDMEVWCLLLFVCLLCPLLYSVTPIC